MKSVIEALGVAASNVAVLTPQAGWQVWNGSTRKPLIGCAPTCHPAEISKRNQQEPIFASHSRASMISVVRICFSTKWPVESQSTVAGPDTHSLLLLCSTFNMFAPILPDMFEGNHHQVLVVNPGIPQPCNGV